MPHNFQLGDVTVDLDTGTLTGATQRSQLSAPERDVLSLLARAPGQVLSYARLQPMTPRPAPSVSDLIIDATVHRLREIFEPDPSHPRHIVAVPGAGYQLVLDPPQPLLRLGRCTVDRSRLMASWPDGRQEGLSAQEGAILSMLSSHSGRVVSRAELLRCAWRGHRRRSPRAVDNAIMRLRARLEPDATSPRYLQTVRGAGYRLICDSAPARPAPVKRQLIGRDTDRAALQALLQAPGLVTLLGPGGVGKTSLAQSIVMDAPMLFCDLSDCREQDEILSAVAATLEVARLPAAPEARLQKLGQALADRRGVLLILDNVEQVAHSAGAVVSAWLEAAPLLRVLVTSRRRIPCPREQVFRLEPLPAQAASALFVVRLAEAGGSLAAGQEEDVAALVEHLDRLPLAIELAAARGRVLTPRAMLQRLDHRLSLLRRRAPVTNPRHATLQAAIRWSWELLSEVEQATLAWCGVWQKSFNLEAADAIISHDADVLDTLRSLKEHSLLVSADGAVPGETRFRLLESVREFAIAQLAAREELDAATSAHAAYYDTLARVLWEDEQLHGEEITIAQWTAALPEFRAATQRQPSRTGWCAAAVLQASNDEGYHQAAASYTCPDALPDAVTANLLRQQAIALVGQGKLDEGARMCQRAVSTARSADAPLVLSFTLATLGSLRGLQRQWERSIEIYEEAASLAQRHGARSLHAKVLLFEGMNRFFFLRQSEAGMDRLQQAAQQIGDSGFGLIRGNVAHHIGLALGGLGRFKEAIPHQRQAVDSAVRLGQRGDVPLYRCYLALSLQAAGLGEEAEDQLRRLFAADALHTHGQRKLLIHLNAGIANIAGGRFPEGEQQLRVSLGLPNAAYRRDEACCWLAVSDAAAGRDVEVYAFLQKMEAARETSPVEPLLGTLSRLCAVLLSRTAETVAAGQQQLSEEQRRLAAPGRLIHETDTSLRLMLTMLAEAAQ